MQGCADGLGLDVLGCERICWAWLCWAVSSRAGVGCVWGLSVYGVSWAVLCCDGIGLAVLLWAGMCFAWLGWAVLVWAGWAGWADQNVSDVQNAAAGLAELDVFWDG